MTTDISESSFSKYCKRCGGKLTRVPSGSKGKTIFISENCEACGYSSEYAVETIELTMPFTEKLKRKFGLFEKISEWAKSDKQKEEARFFEGTATFLVNETDFPLYMFDDNIIQMTPAGYIHIGCPGRSVDRIDYGFFCPTFEQIENIILLQIIDVNKKDQAQPFWHQDIISFITYKLFEDHEWMPFFRSEVFKYMNNEVEKTTLVKPIVIEYENGNQVRWNTKTFQSSVPICIVETTLKDGIVRVCIAGSFVNNLEVLLQNFVQLTKDDVVQLQALDNANLAYKNYKSAKFS